MKTKALVLGAGLGTRLRPLTNTTPKCLVEIDGRPLLDYWVHSMRSAGVTDALVNTHHLREPVRTYLDSKNREGRLKLTETFEDELLGSAGTIANNPAFADDCDDVLVIYSDNLSNVDVGKLIAFHRGHPDPVTMLLFRTPRPEACGIATVDADGRIVEFIEKPQQPKSDLANAGVYVLSSNAYREIAAMDAFDIGFDVLPRFANRMRGFEHAGFHLDIGDYESLERARAEAPRIFGKILGEHP